MAAKSKSKTKSKKKSTPILYSSNIECIEDVIMTGMIAGVIEPYTYWTAYGVEVPNLSPNDVLHLNAQVEVTNPWQFNVQADGAFANGSTYGGNTFNLVGLRPKSGTCHAPHGGRSAGLGDWINWYCLLQHSFGGG
ncbi:MAG TPA: hypothetical protein VEL11_10490 [Candidatus Bathyarchaeia archaeon]|nr:hypothetical protein [Candidatus Bathyarchaeia archaeon]